MAGVLAGSASGGAERDALERARAAARALRGDDDLGLDRADHVKDGLSAIVEVLQKARADDATREWVREARRSVDAVGTFAPLGLQRAAVQDALRTTADAIVVLASEREVGGAGEKRSTPSG
jgi:hypothetical protein